MWPSGLRRHVRDVEIGGSNPLTPTNSDIMKNYKIPLIKRFFDIFFSVGVLIITMPFIFFVLVIIFIEHLLMGCRLAPLFYTEIRYSEGKPFKMIKFNIFNPKIIERLKREEIFIHTKNIENMQGGLIWSGRFLKKVYLDELPQLWNVIKGDLSVVGPRPVNREVLEGLIRDGFRTKLLIRAGMTGSFQAVKDIDGQSDRQLDEAYVLFCQEHSAWAIVANDIKIILATFKLILRARGV